MATRWTHIAFRTTGHRDLLDPAHASWLWRGLERSFPGALIACLMPNHAHLIVPVSPTIPRRLGALLGRFTRRFRDRPHAWEPVRLREPIADREKLRLDYRYVALNGCRANLVDDPLAWLHSTYRDVMGAVARPWVDVDRVADAFGWPRRDLARRLHAFVSSDPSCRVGGTPLPCTRVPTAPSLDVVWSSVAAALRVDPKGVVSDRAARDLFIQVAAHLGWRSSEQLARIAGCSPRTVRRARAIRPDDCLAASVLRCVAEPRFRASLAQI